MLALIAVEALARAKEATQTTSLDFMFPRSKTMTALGRKERRIQELIRGMLSTHPRMMTRKKARAFAVHALDVVALPKYRWLPAETLLGVAANESDFRPWLICEGGKKDPNGWDCGPYQTRVTVFHGRTRKARKLCKRLTQDIGLATHYAAREMTGYKNRYCRGLSPRAVKLWNRKRKRYVRTSAFWRCILNAFNQGPRYFREESCRSPKCLLHSRYWIRVKCWARGIETGRRIKWPYKCRKAIGLRWIKRAYNGGRPGR